MDSATLSTRRVMRTPKKVDIDITSRCNLRCSYCLHFGSDRDVEKELPKEEWLQFFEELSGLSVLGVCLGGGEPFVRNDIKEIIDGVVRNRMRFNVLSNGTLIDDDIAAYLASTNRCDGVQISLDGSCAEVHDACRGSGSFTRALEGLRCLKRNKVPASVRLTINKYNVDDLEAATEYLLEDIGLPSFSCNNAMEMGLCKDSAQSVQLDIDATSRAMEILMQLSKKYPGRITATSGPLSLGPKYLEMEQIRLGIQDNEKTGGCLKSCGAAYGHLNVRADGIVTPCGLLSQIELGRINHDSVQVIWDMHPEMKRLRQREGIPLSSFRYCDGCDYIDNCYGGCPGSAFELAGTDQHPSPESCMKRFMDGGGRLPGVLTITD